MRSAQPGQSGARWGRAARAGPARRAAFAHVVERAGKLADILADAGPARPLNVDGLLLRESMDIIGAPGCGPVAVC